jgi:hypothetical protein
MKKQPLFTAAAILCFFITGFNVVHGQNKLLTEKPGTFVVKKVALNTSSIDLYNVNCGFTKAESDAMIVKLENLVNEFRKIPMLQDVKGFDGICEIRGATCNSMFGYGVTSWIDFYFRTWSLQKGKEVQWRIEPPQWRFVVNMPEKFCSRGFNVTNYSNAYDADNPLFTEEKSKNTTHALRELFFLPGVKENLAPGIDRYGDNVVFYNPEQPVYWEQVTVREVFRLLLDYWKVIPDKAGADAIVPVLTNEFNSFSEAEKDNYAYMSSSETITKIGCEPNETPVMRPNSKYWNRNLPKAAIQFMIMEIPLKEELEQEMNYWLKNEDGSYYEYRFLYELKINLFATYIE